MNSFAAPAAINQYKNTGNSSIAYADPHQLILQLMSGALDRIAQAKGAIQQQDVKMRGESTSKAIGIIDGLIACLDHDQKGDLADNLQALYEYMNFRLLEANVQLDTTKLDEVTRLMSEIRSAWVQIPEEAKKIHP